ncbi:MAG TPA: glycosyltransferase [Dehalococcoidia bacterium]|nr:glycosyltransferase [Dehalococcoidia bacterium]
MVGSLPPAKGISPYMLHLVQSLAGREDVDLEVVTFASIYPRWLYPGGDPEDGSAPSAVPGARVRRLLSWYNPVAALWAGASLRGDVVHAQWWSYVLAPVYALMLAVARLRGKKVVVTVHNAAPHESSRLSRLLNRAVYAFAHSFVVHAGQNRDALRPAARGRRIDVLPMGAIGTAVEPRSKSEARRTAGLDPRAKVVLAFGNIRPYKGLDVLIDAFAAVVRDIPEAVLVIAGKPWSDWQPYESLIASLGLSGRVRLFLDFIPNDLVEALFVASDVVVLPYKHFDAQSAVGAQALAFGRPMVVSDAGGLPELVGRPEAVFPAGDAPALAAALARVLSDGALAQAMARDSERLARELSWDAIAERTVEVYRQVLSGGA